MQHYSMFLMLGCITLMWQSEFGFGFVLSGNLHGSVPASQLRKNWLWLIRRDTVLLRVWCHSFCEHIDFLTWELQAFFCFFFFLVKAKIFPTFALPTERIKPAKQ